MLSPTTNLRARLMNVIIDIGKPPTGSLSKFSICGTFVKQRKKYHMPAEKFDINLFQNHPSKALRIEMKRLEKRPNKNGFKLLVPTKSNQTPYLSTTAASN